MTSLFASFDLGNFFLPVFFMLLVLVGSLSSCYKFYSFNLTSSYVLNLLVEFFLSLKPKNFNKASSLIFSSVFMFLLICNFFSVFSYNFPMMSQISMVSSMSLMFWVSLVVFSSIKNPKGFLSHLIPEGTPLGLTVILFLIEFVSTIIRPITLTVRLAANILAGHLLMVLLSSLVLTIELVFPIYAGLNLIELFVALVQSYIFATMTVLYFSEV